MTSLLDELNELQMSSDTLDVSLVDKKIDKMMPELGFRQEDNDRLVASFRCILTACCMMPSALSWPQAAQDCHQQTAFTLRVDSSMGMQQSQAAKALCH